MKKLLLFDIDGTILNMKFGVSKKIFIDTFFDVFGLKIALEQMPQFSGNTDLQILNQMADSLGMDKDIIATKLEKFWDLKLNRFKKYCTSEYIQLVTGIDSLLESLKKNDDFELSLVTGNSKKNAFQKLSSYQLERYFCDGAFGCDNWNRNLLPPLAVDRVNFRTGSTIYSNNNTAIIGDTISDISAAKSNNMKVMTISEEENIDYFQSQKSDSILTDFLDLDYFYNEMNRIFN